MVFDELDRGVLGEGFNRTQSIGVPGLQFLCNDFTLSTNSSIDIAATDLGDLEDGIQIIQGNLSLGYSAGNIFSQNNSGADNDVSNAAYSFVYGHHGGTSQPASYSTNKVFPAVMQTANPCTPTYQQGSLLLPLTPSAIGSLSSQFESADSAHANILYNLNQLIDGGNTTQMLNQIQQGWSQGAWDLRNDLMSQSPFVSSEVLMEVAEGNQLPHAMLLEVCLANPDATREGEFIDFIETGISNPLPSYMIDMIVASWGNITSRTILESGLGYYGRERSVAANILLADYKGDSLDHRSEIRYWLKRRGELSDHYALVESYIATDHYDSAHIVLTAIPDSFNTADNPYLANAQTDFETYTQFRDDLFDDNRSIMELDSLEILDLQNLAYGSNNRVAGLADNILCFGYGICKDRSASDSTTSTSRRANPMVDAQEFIQSQYYQLRVFPNPASDYATFEWDLINLGQNTVLSIMDATGRVIEQKAMETEQGQWLMDTRPLPPGFYLYELRSVGELLSQGKLLIE